MSRLTRLRAGEIAQVARDMAREAERLRARAEREGRTSDLREVRELAGQARALAAVADDLMRAVSVRDALRTLLA